MLGFLRTKGCLSKSPIDLENPKPYELTITTSPDGQHYQIALRPNERSPRPSEHTFRFFLYHPERGEGPQQASCKTAAFSDDSGLIYLGYVMDCRSPTR